MARWQPTARECWSPLSTEAEKPPAGGRLIRSLFVRPDLFCAHKKLLEFRVVANRVIANRTTANFRCHWQQSGTARDRRRSLEDLLGCHRRLILRSNRALARLQEGH